MSPESAEHAAVIDAIVRQLSETAHAAGLWVRVGHPLALSDFDEPQPDIALVVDTPDRYRQEHPGSEDVRLLVEVAHRSLGKDLGEKVTRFVAAGIDDYWVVDLCGRRTVIHGDPDVDAGEYRSVRIVGFGDPLEPRALAGARVIVT